MRGLFLDSWISCRVEQEGALVAHFVGVVGDCQGDRLVREVVLVAALVDDCLLAEMVQDDQVLMQTVSVAPSFKAKRPRPDLGDPDVGETGDFRLRSASPLEQPLDRSFGK